jgi:hypothetical protein
VRKAPTNASKSQENSAADGEKRRDEEMKVVKVAI